jgi:hypothetical protein
MHGSEVIPAEAVGAAYDALPVDSYVAGTDHVRAMLEAAAPFIAAAAYEADAEAFRSNKSRNPFAWYVSRVMARYFESRADKMRSKA